MGIDYAGGWALAILGVGLLIAEVIAPGFYLIFIGAGAVLAGLAGALFGLSIDLQLVLFVILSAVIVAAGRKLYARPGRTGEHQLNQRSAKLVGRQVTVTQAVTADAGRVRLADGEWSARGGPAAVGQSVVILRVEGNCLIVEAVAGSLG